MLQGDICIKSQLDQAFASASSPVDVDIHLAGLKLVGGVHAAASALLGREREWQLLSA